LHRLPDFKLNYKLYLPYHKHNLRAPGRNAGQAGVGLREAQCKTVRSAPKILSATAPDIITAGLRPELFAEEGAGAAHGRLLVLLLALLVLGGFAFRAKSLSAEGLSEDEVNKLQAVADYRAHGLTAANGEHPLLMKAMLAASIVAAERWNASPAVAAYPSPLYIPVETALRLPNALFGALTALLLYLLAAELFGSEVALIAATLWAFDPIAIGLNRIAKEDTLLLFFFLLANVFWLRSQRVAESGRGRPEAYYWATAAAFGAMLASKYVLFLLGISISYNYIFQEMPQTRWRIGKRRYLIFFAVMGATFLLCNATILLPATWREMIAFASLKRIGHDSYEFMGKLYSQRVTDWLRGVPWYFYFVFMTVKLPLLTLAAFLAGLPLVFRRRLGDGRYFLLFWTLFGFGPFVLIGGKFTRYFTLALPIVLIVAALGLQFVARHLSRRAVALLSHDSVKPYARAGSVLLVVLASAWASASAAPHFRLYTNLLGGGPQRAGEMFPHDEFYDASIGRAMSEIALRAGQGARVASETPNLVAHYARQAGRTDIYALYLSDPQTLKELGPGDLIIAARGRRYLSNDALLSDLRQRAAPAFSLSLGGVPSVEVYLLDQSSLEIVRAHAR
jgi:predicted membrane-bound dolichyl-phosphate-mannose-protein mannosyltransferase